MRGEKICKVNGCQLIYVFPDYNIDDLVKTIDSAIKKNYSPHFVGFFVCGMMGRFDNEESISKKENQF